MAYGHNQPVGPLNNAAYVGGRKVDGTIVSLIGVNASDVVAIDPGDNGWTIGGAFGLRVSAGTIEFKNSGGAWAPVAASAASAGGWTKTGADVALTTATDTTHVANLFLTPAASRYIAVDTDHTGTGRLVIQAGGGSPGFGASIILNSHAHATKPGWVTAGISVASGGKFSVNGEALGGGIDFFTVDGGGNVVVRGSTGAEFAINESGDIYNVRIESDSNSNHFISDGGAFAGVGAFAFGDVALAGRGYFYISPPNLVYTSTAPSVLYVSPNVMSVTGVTAVSAATVRFDEPNISLGTGTVADAYTVIITSAPTEGTRNGALWVGAGQVRFSGMPTSAAGLPSGTLWSNSGVVNIVP